MEEEKILRHLDETHFFVEAILEAKPPVIFGNHLSIKRVVRMAQGKDCQSRCWSQRCKAPRTNFQKSLDIIFLS